MKKLVVYYSLSGNTKMIAEMIQTFWHTDIAKIKTTIPYPTNFDAIVEQGKDEVERHYLPAIEKLKVNISDYDTIIIGTPTWWYTMSPAVLAFLSQNNWSGKTVSLFQTHGGGEGHTLKGMETICKGASFKQNCSIYFDYYNKNKLITPLEKIKQWIEKI